jgi:hypothetical protein
VYIIPETTVPKQCDYWINDVNFFNDVLLLLVIERQHQSPGKISKRKALHGLRLAKCR